MSEAGRDNETSPYKQGLTPHGSVISLKHNLWQHQYPKIAVIALIKAL